MLTPKPGQELPKHLYSRTKILFVCDCGAEKWLWWKNYSTRHAKSCGQCKLRTKYNIDIIKHKKFHHLKVNESKIPNKVISNTKLSFICDCGNIKDIVLKSVISGLTKTCGKCKFSRKGEKGKKWIKPEIKSKSYWLNQKMPLQLITQANKLPVEWSHGTKQSFEWLCGCGKIFIRPFGKVYSGHTSSCGKCNFIKKESVIGEKYGKLTLIDKDLPNEFHNNTSKCFWYKCDCGKVSKHGYSKVISGGVTSCGRCNLMPQEWWSAQTFGHLVIIEPRSEKKGSESKLKCLCSCGNICMVSATGLVRGYTKSCGLCMDRAHKWWIDKKDKLTQDVDRYGYSLKALQSYFAGSYLTPLESAHKKFMKIKFKCQLCNSEYMADLGGIIHSKVASCGCIKGSTSFANSEIGRYVESFGVECFYGKHEKIIDNYKVDVYVPSRDLIIEHHGLRYHSTEFKDRNYDFKKHEILSKNHNCIIIYGDEWEYNTDHMRFVIANSLGIIPKHRLKLSDCIVVEIDNETASGLCDRFYHYRHVNSKYVLGTYYKNELVAYLSISYDLKLTGMVINYDYAINNLWSHLLNKLMVINKLCHVIAFSDNAIPNSYAEIGFQHISDIAPDYQMVRGSKRHKKDKSDGHKIYDCGKKEWRFNIKIRQED